MTNCHVRLILGPAKSGKTRRALQCYADYLDRWRHNPAEPLGVWIAPTPSAISDVRDRLATQSRGAFLHLNVLTFAMLAEEILARVGMRIRSIGLLEKHRFLEHVISNLVERKQLRYFTSVARMPGFIRQVAAGIADLKRRGVNPEDFQRVASNHRDHDVGAIYTAYEQHLVNHRLYDAEGRISAACAALSRTATRSGDPGIPGPRCGPAEILEFGLVVVDGFADFTSAQHELLKLLADRCEELLIALPADQGEGNRSLLFDKPNRTLGILKRAFPQLHRETASDTHFSSESLAFVERKLFDDTNPPPFQGGHNFEIQRGGSSGVGIDYASSKPFHTSNTPSPSPSPGVPREGDLAIVAASSAQGEIREIARRVKQLIVSRRAQPEEIAVVFPSVADVTRRVEEVFRDFGLPTAIDHREPIGVTPLVRTIAKLLRLHAEDWPFELLLEVVGNRTIRVFGVEAQGLHPLGPINHVAALERSIRRAQLPSGRTLLMEQLRQWAEPKALASGDVVVNVESESPEASAFGSGLEDAVRDAQLALPSLENLERHLAPLPTRASLTDWLSHVEHVVRSIGVLHEANSEQWLLLRQHLVLVDQVDATFAAESSNLTPQQFLGLLESTTSQVLLPNLVDPIGRVRVLSAESGRNLSVKHVFLASLSEQSYSSAEGSRQLYREREILRFVGDMPDNLAERQAGETMLLFYDMVTRASESLTLSYAALDDKGQALQPSPYLTELQRCVAPSVIPIFAMPPGIVVPAQSLPLAEAGAGTQQVADPLSRTDWRLSAVSTALEGDRKWLAGLASDPTTRPLGRAVLRGIASVASRSDRDRFGPFEGVLVSDIARAAIAKRFDAEHLWSASQLELYATCPYQFFAAQLLRLQPLQEITLRSDHLRRGNLLHQVLYAVHARQTDTPQDAALVERFASALEKAISEMPLHGLERALLEIEYREILSWAPQYAEQELAYGTRWTSCDVPPEPTYFEVRFGPKARTEGMNDAVSTLVPFTLDLGSEQIKLTGQIDRIDMGQIGGVTVFNIIDYKSGQEVKLSDKEMRAGRQLQLPLYALAAEKLLFADANAVALATGYWSIKSGGFAKGREAVLEFRTSSDKGLVDSDRWVALNESITNRVAEIVRAIRAAEFPVYNDNLKCTQYCDFSRICRIAQIRSLEKVWISEQT